ncbi:hypothetical protein BXZ70DRAFT_550688 [Cristinia sonorae]|uniref:Uncharacterized protein n=1 Tax=Cristinia sonorae TaxID=1940300 RepID=A0A8K0UH27_9AGAR|nr:hypothetical protein BXZ70DRAFT_550688 [Cristinia sonorae]
MHTRSQGLLCYGLPFSTFLTAFLWTTSLFSTSAFAKVTPFLPQGFMFDWTPEGQTPPVPTTAQCETIHIKWNRGTLDGPNPTAPYYLQIYTSTFIVPFVIEAGSSLNFDWVVPFVPGTQYQICMFDSKGNAGGCQAVYTVYQAPGTTIENPPTCTNLTYPRPESQLGVSALVNTGPFSQFGWIDQCTDLSVTPTSGTPPYTLTVAPALHPPYNITSQDRSPINWTVSLSWGSPFFVSLVDSTGMTWASGPLHSGGGGTTDCLALDDTSSTGKTVAPAVAIGAGVGGLILGLVVGLLSAFLFTFFARRHRERQSMTVRESSGMLITTTPPRGVYRDLPSDSRNGLMHESGYRIEPFTMPGEREFGVLQSPGTSPGATNPTFSTSANLTSGNASNHLQPSDARSTSSGPGSHSGVSSTSAMGQPTTPPPRPRQIERGSGQVYVVHHDGGGAPISVYTEEGAEVVELPPHYPHDGQGASSARSPLARNRRPGALPEKPSHHVTNQTTTPT